VQLSSQQLYIKAGEISIIDASVIQAKQNRPNKGVDGNSTQDQEAGYHVKASSDGKQKTTYGYKAHIAVEEDGFIKASAFTAGNIHDSQCLAPLLSEKSLQSMQTAPIRARSMMRCSQHAAVNIVFWKEPIAISH